ncbi:MAG: hypothetical protein ACXVCS_12020 [Bdellovibrionota bacterium]
MGITSTLALLEHVDRAAFDDEERLRPASLADQAFAVGHIEPTEKAGYRLDFLGGEF